MAKVTPQIADRKKSNAAAGTSTKTVKPAPPVVVFEDPAKRHKREKEEQRKAALKEKEEERKEAEAKAGARPEFGDLWSLKREIHDFGAKAFDKKTSKRDKTEQLEKLGVKAAKNPRTPAKIGFGMAQAKAKREEKALEELYETGMLKRKGTGQKKRREKNASRDKGLMELADFHGGMLKVKKTKFKEKKVGKINFGKMFK